MKSRIFSTVIVALLVVAVINPLPRQAYAQGVPTSELPISTLTVKTIFTEINTFLTELNTYAQYVNTYVLQPIALIKSGNLLKAMTAGVIAYVTGVANGTGASQFVQDLQKNLQKVGDTQAAAFFIQYSRNSNSPFSSSITSSLRNYYLQNTSAAGFWSSYRSTLSLASPNVNAFLGGNWSQGGVRAWLALTTQPQNNPYALYQASQRHLSSVVTGATTARLQTLNWGQGFLSWCGSIPEGLDTESGDYAPTGDPCINSDGTPGIIKTPGSVISASLSKVLGGQQDKLIQIGSVAKDIGGIMGNLASIWQTIQFAQQVLGSSNTGGLYGLGQSINTNPDRRPNDPPPDDGGPTPHVTVAAMLQRLEKYETAWDTIAAAANTASTNVTSLRNYCESSATTAANDLSLSEFVVTARNQANSARDALTTLVAPVFTQVSTASSTVAAARTFLARMQATTTPSAADTQALQTLRPSAADTVNAEQNAANSSGAIATPQGSLNVSSGSLADQMNLLGTNATALRATCTIPGTIDPGPGDGNVVDGGNLPNLYGSATVGQLERVFTSTANQAICFNANLNPQDVGDIRRFYWGTDNTSYLGGNITYWISQTFGGSALPGYQGTRAFAYTGTMDFTVPAAGTYYWCLNLDTAGNKVHVQLMVGSSSSGG